MSERFPLYDAAGVAVLLDGMARKAAALLDDTPLTVIGVLRRGAPLADALHARLQKLRPGWEIERIDLKVKRYSDDLQLLHADTLLETSAEQAARQFEGRRLLVVDDVLYQGYSLFRVLEYLRDRKAESIHAAVLVDRAVTRLPIQADIVGATLQIAPADVIECNVPPYEPQWRIDLYRL
ncbi:MAG: phosphoribosyltransferase family protein [Lysobacterales bacterium]